VLVLENNQIRVGQCGKNSCEFSEDISITH